MITALVAAGRRPGTDPLAAAYGVEDKALIEIAGAPMLAHVLRTLVAHEAIGAIRVLCQDPERLRAHPAIAALADAEPARIGFAAGGDSVSQAVSNAIAADPAGFPFLLTTADNVLLDRAMLDHFIAVAKGADAAAAVVARSVFVARFPEARRTWLRFARGAYSGANLFWFGSGKARRALDLWRTIEQDRKRGRAVIAAFGMPILIGTAVRILSLRRAVAMAGKRLGLKAAAVELPFAEACIDVDKPEDHALAERLLAMRKGPQDPSPHPAD